MKRIVCLFAFCCIFICFGFSFVNPNESIVRIVTTIKEISVSDASVDASENGNTLYTLYGGLDDFMTASGSLVQSKTDISKDDLIVYFRIHQNYKVKTKEIVYLTVIASPMILNEVLVTKNKTNTDAPVLYDAQGLSTLGLLNVSHSLILENSLRFELNYLDSCNVVDGRDIGYFVAKWKYVNGLENGLYNATVTMTLETN